MVQNEAQESAADSVEGIPGLAPWSPHTSLREIDSHELRYSRGFLRSRPEKWFPGFAAQWLPLAHSLGAEMKMVEVKPTLLRPAEFAYGSVGSVGDRLFTVILDDNSADAVTNLFCPGAYVKARSIVLEYLGRRLIGSFALAWTGAEARQVRYRPDLNVDDVEVAGAIRLTIEGNGRTFKAWVGLSEELVDQLDGLWRRQVHSSSRTAAVNGTAANGLVSIELAQLAVPPSVLSEYLRSGAVVDLETPVSDLCTLQLEGKPWLPARLCRCEDNLAVEIVSGPVSNPSLPHGTTRLCIELGSFSVSAEDLAELGQIGSLWDVNVEATEQVYLTINSERVGEARLCSFQGRFAIAVV